MLSQREPRSVRARLPSPKFSTTFLLIFIGSCIKNWNKVTCPKRPYENIIEIKTKTSTISRKRGGNPQRWFHLLHRPTETQHKLVVPRLFLESLKVI